MRADPAYRKITADEFLEIDFGTDRKFELEDGVIVMMTGGTEAHAWVQGNIFAWLRTRLKGSGCRPYGSEMAVRVSETDVRYPDISIYCGPRDAVTEAKSLSDPVVIIEVLSPSTTTLDQGTKLEEYRRIASVRTIAFVDPINEMCRTFERQSENGWHDHMFSGRGGIAIPALDLTIPHDEIFARD
ncbi:Uma2 family endonuclease [Sphingomonas sp.]|uniref:Uma2 family endonuclease n=1 Tax=Sphingomonas sp. TaxID=28214 RepID=UPI001B09D39B|nr:Uma2 family endonuclease [Sphingomonas sp.]MBO9714287.1 Uma2 family endonuclease [Sphingomonas sp.]